MSNERNYFSNIDVKYEGDSEEFICKNLDDYLRTFNRDDLPVLYDWVFMDGQYNKYIIGQICGVSDESGMGAYFVDPAIVYGYGENDARKTYAKFNCIDYSKCDIISTSIVYSTLYGRSHYKQFQTSDRMIGYCPILLW